MPDIRRHSLTSNNKEIKKPKKKKMQHSNSFYSSRWTSKPFL